MAAFGGVLVGRGLEVKSWQSPGRVRAKSRKSLLGPISAECRAEFQQARRVNLIQEKSFLQDGPGLNDHGAQKLGLLHPQLWSQKLAKALESYQELRKATKSYGKLPKASHMTFY